MSEGADSPHAEAYRVLRTNILFSRKDTNWRTMTVVSGGAGEGKSTTIFNLATVFAQNGNRVLIVDSDLRRPSLHKILNVANNLGLTNYLLKQNRLEEVIQTTPVPSLDFMPSGRLPSSSIGILNSAAMKEFIAEAKSRYDFVFFDSPPIMGVSDASILASEVDMAVLVEVHDAAELERVLALEGVQLIGINNRNLATFDTDLATTEQLTERYGEQIRAKGCLLVSESGLFTRDDLDRVQSAGADAVLVGESLMRQNDVTAALEALIAG